MTTEEKTMFGKAIVYVAVLTPEEFSQVVDPTVTSVHCFPVRYKNEVLLTLNQRGVDLIGGHVEAGETPEQAMHREADEEACIVINDMKIIGAVRVDNRDNPHAETKGYPPIGYQIFYKVDDFDLKDFVQTLESTGRVFLPKNEIPSLHHNWLNIHSEMLKAC